MTRIISLTLIILIMLFSAAMAAEPITGEIININYQYKIAFTDLNNYHLKNGDIVKVTENNKFLTYLEVADATEAISKLIPVQSNKKYITNIPFSKIQVGSVITKEALKSFQVKNTYNATMGVQLSNTNKTLKHSNPVNANIQTIPQGNTTPNNFQELSNNYIILSNNLARLLNEKTSIEQDNMQSKQELEIAIARIQELEAQNTLLNNELSALKSRGAAKKNHNRIKKLESTINVLKKKLENMSLLLAEGN